MPFLTSAVELPVLTMPLKDAMSLCVSATGSVNWSRALITLVGKL